MDWFKRAKEGLKPQKRKDMPNLWVKCDSCEEIIYKKELERNSYVCSKCQFHFRIKSSDYISILIDDNTFEEFNRDIMPIDALKFKANKKYSDQIKDAIKKTGNNDAIITGHGQVYGYEVVLCIMDFGFIGGSMGSVVGEKIARAADVALNKKVPLIVISASGGARMMEGAMSLMQMAKTSARLAKLADAGLLYVSILTDPTTGGVTASYAMLGDVIIAEPGALIGFAGPHVIKQTIGQDLPDGFQRSEFQLKHGFVDAVVSRHEMKSKLKAVFDFVSDQPHAYGSQNGLLTTHETDLNVDDSVVAEKLEDVPSSN